MKFYEIVDRRRKVGGSSCPAALTYGDVESALVACVGGVLPLACCLQCRRGDRGHHRACGGGQHDGLCVRPPGLKFDFETY